MKKSLLALMAVGALTAVSDPEQLQAELAKNADELRRIGRKKGVGTGAGVQGFLGIGQTDHATGRLISDHTPSHGRITYPGLVRDTTRCVRPDCTQRTKRQKRRPPFPGAPKVAVWVCPTHGPLWPLPEAERLIVGVLDEVATYPNGEVLDAAEEEGAHGTAGDARRVDQPGDAGAVRAGAPGRGGSEDRAGPDRADRPERGAATRRANHDASEATAFLAAAREVAPPTPAGAEHGEEVSESYTHQSEAEAEEHARHVAGRVIL